MTDFAEVSVVEYCISIHMPHTWHDVSTPLAYVTLCISIHMPHTWHDKLLFLLDCPTDISIHMPHTWHDRLRIISQPVDFYFNPHATYVA